jgi:hypothetical protein
MAKIVKKGNEIIWYEGDLYYYSYHTDNDITSWTHWCHKYGQEMINEFSWFTINDTEEVLCHCCLRVFTQQMKNQMLLWTLDV